MRSGGEAAAIVAAARFVSEKLVELRGDLAKARLDMLKGKVPLFSAICSCKVSVRYVPCWPLPKVTQYNILEMHGIIRMSALADKGFGLCQTGILQGNSSGIQYERRRFIEAIGDNSPSDFLPKTAAWVQIGVKQV